MKGNIMEEPTKFVFVYHDDSITLESLYKDETLRNNLNENLSKSFKTALSEIYFEVVEEKVRDYYDIDDLLWTPYDGNIYVPEFISSLNFDYNSIVARAKGLLKYTVKQALKEK